VTTDPSDLRAVTGTIFAVDQTAVHDGPGLRMNVYLKGCPLECVWCHSPESIDPAPQVIRYGSRCVRCGACADVCPEGRHAPEGRWAADGGLCQLCGQCVSNCPSGALALSGQTVTAGDVVDEADRLRPWFRRSGGGVTLTGGEPLLQHTFAHAVASLCRDVGIHVAVETTGHASWSVLEPLAEVVDLFLYDLKHADADKHRELTGVSNQQILDNLERLTATGAEVVVRVPVIPGTNDSDADIRGIAGAARERGVGRITLLPYNPAAGGKYEWLGRPYALDKAARQSDDEMRRLEALVRAEGLEIALA